MESKTFIEKYDSGYKFSKDEIKDIIETLFYQGWYDSDSDRLYNYDDILIKANNRLFLIVCSKDKDWKTYYDQQPVEVECNRRTIEKHIAKTYNGKRVIKTIKETTIEFKCI